MQRRAIQVRGIVQGVGFRPFVYELASQLALGGFVRNSTGLVEIEVEGEGASLDAFFEALVSRPPPLAHINAVTQQPIEPKGEAAFRIEASHASPGEAIYVSPDVATCPACLAELFDPANRRYRYPFINCTACGPRLTIITGSPYDRAQTTMAAFAMCDACRHEYENPADRRFHAEPIACAACGPSLVILNAQGIPIDVDNPLVDFARRLLARQIGAIKGLGGYHLACDATSETAVETLRARKHREDKPLAVMVTEIAAAERLCHVSAAERALLESSHRPIVLLAKRAANTSLARSIAPGNPCMGIMLPYAPLHHLLMAAVDGRPLVMTSANRTDEPIAYRDDEALVQLAGIADVFLAHDRPIRVRCDDSVVRVVVDRPEFVRRSRGYAPAPIELPIACARPVLAVGGQLKATFAILNGSQAIVSHHLGDLDHYEAYRAMVRDIDLYERLFDLRPAVIVHDLHPDYASTRYAIERAVRDGVPRLAVQHHHAHLASCLADNGLAERAIGVVLDGTGYGLDGAIWGGEFLVGDFAGFRRAAHLRYVGMPGADRAIREPWRMAVAHALDAGCAVGALPIGTERAALRTVERMLDRRFNAPRTSSVGRLFDAVASLIGLRHEARYEAQAAIELEWLAATAPSDGSYSYELLVGGSGSLTIDTRPMIREIIADTRQSVAVATIARRFHDTLAPLIVDVCRRLRVTEGIDLVALSGGVFHNALLATAAQRRLRVDGFRVIVQRQVPPGDGGLSLGQLAVAAQNVLASTFPTAR